MALPSHKHNSTIILDMMRFMSFFHGFLVCRQHGPRDFIATIDHYTHFRLGFIPIESNYRYMTLLHKERLRAFFVPHPIRLSCSLISDETSILLCESNGGAIVFEEDYLWTQC